MPRLLLLNKPFDVQCKFTDEQNRPTLADFCSVKNVYAAGRLDADSEGLLILSDAGWLSNLIADPKHKLPKTYLVQVEGAITPEGIDQLKKGVVLKDGLTKPAEAKIVPEPEWLWERTPSVRFRAAIPTSWIELTIREGRNRQVRRMTAHVGFPTLRLIRHSIGPWSLDGIANGSWQEVPMPATEQEARTLFAPWVQGGSSSREGGFTREKSVRRSKKR